MSDICLEDLDTLYKAPGKLVLQKVLTKVDPHGVRFVALSPFCVISSAARDGTVDVSPRGGEPGFVHVSPDGATLYLPDRPGNNRLDTLRNLLGGSGQVGLMFMIPGFDDVYRVNGQITASADDALLSQFIEFGKTPRLVLKIAVKEAFFHCPKAIMRGRLWDPEARIDRSVLPSGAEIIFDQLAMGKPTISNDAIIDSYKTQL